MATETIVQVPIPSAGTSKKIDNRQVPNAAGPGGLADRQVVALGDDAGVTYTALVAPALGAIPSLPVRAVGIIATTSVLTNVAQNAASVTLVVVNPVRIGFTLYNDSAAILYVKLGATATLTSFSFMLQAGGVASMINYVGVVDGIWAAGGAGSARVTELT